MEKLLPCPFCGTDAMIKEGGGRYFAVCNSLECFCAVGEDYDAYAMPDHIFYDAETAAKAWNKRAPAQEWQDISTALKQAVAYADIVAQSEGMPAGKRAGKLTATAVNLDGTAFVTAEFDVKKARAALDALIADDRGTK